jgi:hypothetical protein
MHFPVTDFRPQRTPEPPAMVRVMTRSDVMWNRPVFKAPPLVLDPRKFDASRFADELRRSALPER